MMNETHSIVDSLVANEFEVRIDDQPVSGVFSISGLVTFRLDVKTTTTIKKLQDPFILKKMVQRDPLAAFNQWIRDTFAAGDDIIRPTRTLTITAVDDGTPIRRWTVKKAWIAEVKYSDFNSSSSEMIEETIKIHYEDIDESWPLLVEADPKAQLPEPVE
ncbi:MAG: phage tail protein [Anaerolineae bacterium]|nr:phage tail protein [Anaerolineae bacterium]